MKHLPWKASQHTQIWEVVERLRARPNKGMDTPQDDASVAVWLVHAPWMAPLAVWHWHYVSLIHLRDLPNQTRPPTLNFEGATHEFIAIAVSPDMQLDIQADPLPELQFLRPMSIVQQFKAANDAEALAKVEQCLAHTVTGRVTLESDGRAMWRHMLLEH